MCAVSLSIKLFQFLFTDSWREIEMRTKAN